MIDVRSGNVLYYPQYASEGFCYRNPQFIEAYCDYAKRLIADTGIDGLAAEDTVHYMHLASCGCPHCRAELKRRTGMDLPEIDDRSFWGNWKNPAWRQWLDLRFESGKAFFEKLTPQLPKDFVLTTCGANSAAAAMTGAASDASRFTAGGSNYVHMEMSGNTPPYKKDPVTVNIPVATRMVGFSHHQAVARENHVRAFSTGYGFTEPSANIIWAVNKLLDTDCCFSTLKARLGLPTGILNTLPEEAEVVGKAYTFEKEHPQLFAGEQVAQVGVYFSYETRNNTMFGSLQHGYYADYSATLRILSTAGLSAHTLIHLPRDPKDYPVIILSAVARMTAEEKAQLNAYMAKGGKVLVCGPTDIAQCESKWELPASLQLEDPLAFFSSVRDGVWIQAAKWVTDTRIAPSAEEKQWRLVAPGLYYHPHRISDGGMEEVLLEMVRGFIRKMPVEILSSKGYLTTMFHRDGGYNLHFLAEDYDVDIDHKLDDMRFHRSRVNFVNKIAPMNVDRRITIRCEKMPQVFTPFNHKKSAVQQCGEGYEVTLPENTAYAIIRIED